MLTSKHSLLCRKLVICLLCLSSAASVSALTIVPGTDIWVTPPDSGTADTRFVSNPIPADFFNPGSVPFEGTVYWTGRPLQTTPAEALGPTDFIVRRMDTLALPAPGAVDQVPIEIVALSLVSVQPITVNYSGGGTEQWMVELHLSSTFPQQPGQMNVQQMSPAMSFFDITYQIRPRYVFTIVNPPGTATRVIDDGIPTQLSPGQTSRVHHAPPPSLFIPQSDGFVTVDHDGDPITPEVNVPAGNPDFIAGLGPLPDDPLEPSLCEGMFMLRQLGSMTHNLLPTILFGQSVGSVCLPTGGCAMTTQFCSDAVGGSYWEVNTTCYQRDFCVPTEIVGMSLQQVDFLHDGAVQLNSTWGRLEIDVPLFTSQFSSDSGYVNIYTDLGWSVQNFKIDGTDHLTTYFEITDTPGEDITLLSTATLFTPNPVAVLSDGPRALLNVTPVSYNAGGFELTPFTTIASPLPADFFIFIPAGLTQSHTQPNKSNVQAAKNQCFPMGIANSLQYLEDRYGLPVPHHHGKGLKGDTTLVGQLDSASNRGVTSRANGNPIGYEGMIGGKFKYMKDNNLKGKIVTKHQGNSAGGGHTGDYTSSGITSKDESVGGNVTWQWICDEIKKGEDVELGFLYDGGGGHIVRVFECGTTLGIPWVGYAHDRLQSDQDPGDSLGLECVRKYLVDTDGDGRPNIGADDREVTLAVSESADTDQDGVTNGIDNAPNHFNPGQEDLDNNGVGDVAEPLGNLESNGIPPFDLPAGLGQSFGLFPNPLFEFPDHKDIWFVGQATNPSATDSAKITVSFTYTDTNGVQVNVPSGDTTFIPAGKTFEFFGSYQLPYCVEEVAVSIEAIGSALQNINGMLHHICYQSQLSEECCVGITGNIDGLGGEPGIDIADLLYFVDYQFGSPPGPPPPCLEEADVDGSLSIDIADLLYMVDYQFGNPAGPAPVPCP